MEGFIIPKLIGGVNDKILDLWKVKLEKITTSEADTDTIKAYNQLHQEAIKVLEHIIKESKREGLVKANLETYVMHRAKEYQLQYLIAGKELGERYYIYTQYLLDNIDYKPVFTTKGYPIKLGNKTITISIGKILYLRRLSYELIHNSVAKSVEKDGQNRQTLIMEVLVIYIRILITIGITSKEIEKVW